MVILYINHYSVNEFFLTHLFQYINIKKKCLTEDNSRIRDFLINDAFLNSQIYLVEVKFLFIIII